MGGQYLQTNGSLGCLDSHLVIGHVTQNAPRTIPLVVSNPAQQSSESYMHRCTNRDRALPESSILSNKPLHPPIAGCSILVSTQWESHAPYDLVPSSR